MEPRDFFHYGVCMEDMDNWFKGTRTPCTIEVLIRDKENDRVNIYGAYVDSIKNEDMKLSFTTVHDDKSITIHLNTVSKVTINKESK